MKRFQAFVLSVLSAVLMTAGMAMPAEAVTRPTVTAHYVYNCTNPTVEVNFSKISGVKDVYWKTDQGIYSSNLGFNFDTTKVYDGYLSLSGVYQVEVYVTAAGAGPYANHLAGKQVAANSLCPTYYPTYDAHYVDPTPPAGSLPITLDTLDWYPNND